MTAPISGLPVTGGCYTTLRGTTDLAIPDDYGSFLDSLKERVRAAQTQARRTVNTQLIGLYWFIGHEILTRQDHQGWGSGVIGRLATDLRTEFPEMTGLSRSNLQYMRSFAEAWPVFDTNVPQAGFGTD